MDLQAGVPAKAGKKLKAAGTFTFHNHNVENYSLAAKQSDNRKRSQTFTVLKEQNVNLLRAEDASKNCQVVSIADLVQYYETKLKTAQQVPSASSCLLRLRAK